MDQTNYEELAPTPDMTPTPSTPEKKRKKGLKRVLVIIPMLFFILLAFGAGTIYGKYFSIQSSSGGARVNNKKVMQKLSILEEVVDHYFYYDADPKKLENGIYHGFMAALGDPYAAYYTEEEYKQMTDEDSGEYKGIGISVIKNTTNNFTEIVTVNKGDPAYEAGMKVGDFIVKVNGKETQDMTLTEVVTEIKSSEDPVAITVYRGTELLEFSVNKSTITINSVEYEMKEDQIGYISVSQFIDNTDEQFIDAIAQLEKQGMKKLIVDLRDNGGGNLDTCLNMVSRIIPEGDRIVYTKTKDGTQEDYNSTSAETLKIPMVILVNGNTASASEIFTGCLKDYSLATVIGTKTFGKGIVQFILPLNDGSAMKLTVSGYFTPNGTDIHKKGIEPDETIEVSDEELKEALEDPSKDVQLKRAIEILKSK